MPFDMELVCSLANAIVIKYSHTITIMTNKVITIAFLILIIISIIATAVILPVCILLNTDVDQVVSCNSLAEYIQTPPPPKMKHRGRGALVVGSRV